MKTGRIIGGKYRVRGRLGDGRHEELWAADHQLLGRAVALKFLRANAANAANAEQAAARFVEEARSAAQIKHRFVLDVFDFGITEDGVSYAVQELLEGQSLAQCLIQGPAWEVENVVKFAIQGLEGLEALHHQGLVHGHLTPENVFIVRERNEAYPKLLSMRSVEANGGQRAGTSLYMAPEQLSGREPTARCDLYSMGAILYQWLTGLLPYTEQDAVALAREIAAKSATPLSAVRPDLGQELADVITRALEPSPQARFASAVAMRDALAALAGRLPQASSIVQDWATTSGLISGVASVPPVGLASISVQPGRKPSISKETELLLRSASTALQDDGEEVRLPLTGLGGVSLKPWMLAATGAALLILLSVPMLRSTSHSFAAPEPRAVEAAAPAPAVATKPAMKDAEESQAAVGDTPVAVIAAPAAASAPIAKPAAPVPDTAALVPEQAPARAARADPRRRASQRAEHTAPIVQEPTRSESSQVSAVLHARKASRDQEVIRALDF